MNIIDLLNLFQPTLGILPAIPLIASAVIGAAGNALGSSKAAKAAKAQAQAQGDINKQQLDFARELRGANDTPVFLPIYSKGREKELFRNANSLFNAANPADNRAGEVSAITQPFEAAFGSAFRSATDGSHTGRSLANTAPVRSARTNSATAQLDSINQALDELLSQQNAQASQKGFAGGGSFRNNRALQSTLGARQEAANAMSAADLANAIEEASIRNQGEDLAMQLGLQSPELAKAALSLNRAPNTVPIQEYLDALQVFAPFNTSQNNNAAASLVGGLQAPQFSGVSPAANALGFASGAASQYASYLQQNEAAKQQQAFMNQLLQQQNQQQPPIPIPATGTP